MSTIALFYSPNVSEERKKMLNMEDFQCPALVGMPRWKAI